MSKKKVLVADGDITLAESIADQLQDADLQAKAVSSGEEAIKTLRDEWMDLLILSVKLQGEMDGFQLIKMLKEDEELSEIPVIIESDKPGMKDVFKEIGALDFFTKPYSPGDIIKKAKEILA